MEFFVISYTGLQLPGSSLGQPAVCRDKAAKSVGPVSQVGSQTKAAVQLRPGARARVSLKMFLSEGNRPPMWHLAALLAQRISQQGSPRLHSCTISELAWIWGVNSNHVQKKCLSTE